MYSGSSCLRLKDGTALCGSLLAKNLDCIPPFRKARQEDHEIPTVYHLLSTSKAGAFAGNLRAVWAVMVTQAEGGQACQRPAWSGLAYAQLPESSGTTWRL